MAGDWIKMRVWLASDPQTLGMADFLSVQRSFMDWLTDPVRRTCDESCYEHVTRNVTARVTVSGLLLVWGVANDRGKPDGDDLILCPCSLDHLDDIAGIPCFGDAMADVGWAVQEERTDGALAVRFPKFLQNNVPAEDRSRKNNAERQRRLRERRASGSVTDNDKGNATSNATSNVTVTHREEKRREDMNASPNGEASLQPSVASPPSGVNFPLSKGTLYDLPQVKLDEYLATFADRLDVCFELRKARQWLMDNKSRRPASATGIKRFLTSWLNRAVDGQRGGIHGGQPPPADDLPKYRRREPQTASE